MAHPVQPAPDSPGAASVDGAPPSAEGMPTAPGGPHHRMLENDRATAWLGAEVLQADPGHARLRMRVRREMTNGFDIAHGGMIFALADTCFAMACNDPSEDDGTITVASGADITFLQPARTGEELVAEAVQIARAGRSGVYDVTVTRDGEPVAVVRGRSRTVPAAPATPTTAETAQPTSGEK